MIELASDENQSSEPRYSQPEILKVSALSPATLQTWVNRRAITLSDHNPGSGRKRLYSKEAAVRLAVMGRLTRLGLSLSRAKEVAGLAVDLLPTGNLCPEVAAVIRPPVIRDGLEREEPPFEICWSREELVQAVANHMDGLHLPTANRPHPGGEQQFSMHRQQRQRSKNTALAQARGMGMSIHAEPVIVFPLGQIVSGVIAQLEKLDRARRED